ncbi:hypothetical protein S83_002298 [Arachis hypogaea]
MVMQSATARQAENVAATTQVPHCTESVIFAQNDQVVRCLPPPQNVLKLNVDAAISHRGDGGAGAVVRDEEGHILMAATWRLEAPVSVKEAEARALMLGSELASQTSQSKIEDAAWVHPESRYI